MRRLLVMTWVLFAAYANAQVIFRDNFETGTLLTSENPPGSWALLNGSSGAPWQTMEASDAGAFSGSYGMFLTDFFDGGSGLMTGKHLRYDFAVTTGDVYTRARFKVTKDAGSGGPYVVQMHGNIFNGTIAELGFEGPGDEISLNCGDATTFVKCPNKRILTLNEWHELNLVMEGLGTSTGTCALVLDGTQVCSEQLDWTSVGAVAILAGTGAMNSTWDGTLSLDDVAITSGQPPPSAFYLGGQSPVDAGTCSALLLGVGSGINVAKFQSPFSPTSAWFDAGVPIEVFEDSDCTLPSDAGVLVAVTSSFRLVGIKFLAGNGAVTVAATDVTGELRPGYALIDLNNPPFDAGAPDAGLADAGTPDAGTVDAGDADAGALDAGGGADAGVAPAEVRGAYDIGCGCGGAGGAPLIFVLAGCLLRRRRGAGSCDNDA